MPVKACFSIHTQEETYQEQEFLQWSGLLYPKRVSG